ncbi:hypothetical protein Q604_UNBC17710G0001, partial [human gut metagenome]
DGEEDLEGEDEPSVFTGERIDVLDFEMEGNKYKQIRYFRKGISKSQYIAADLIKKIVEVNK